MKNLYLDHLATTPVDPEVIKEMTDVLKKNFGNPSSIHKFGQNSRLIIEKSREVFAKFLNAKPLEIVFTSGGTEADNLAIIGAARANTDKGKHIITSKIEHSAVLDAARYLEEKESFKISFVKIKENGLPDITHLKKLIREDTILISLMYVNNEIGTISQIEEIANLCHQKNILFHTDAVQAFGKIEIDLQKIPIDLLSASAHKIYGPKGIGFLYIRKGVKVDKRSIGGYQEYDMRGGTENIAGISGFAKATELAFKHLEQDKTKISYLQNYFIDRVLNEISGAKLNGDRKNRIFHNISFSFENIEAAAVLHYFDRQGIAISAGSACSSGSLNPSRVITVIEKDKNLHHSAIRIGLGRSTTKEDLDYVLDELKKIIEKLRN
jgi:cysteine desulfurase